MSTTLTRLNSTLAAIETALPIDPQPYAVGERPTGLIVVDVVNGFCTVGYGFCAPSAPDEQIATMVSESDRLARSFVERGWPVLAFLDTHEPGKPEPPYLPHCEKGTGEEKLVSELEWLENHPLATLVAKDCINGFIGSIDRDTGRNILLDWISDRQLEVLVVVGICTDICVMDFVITMLSVRNHGLSPTLKDVVVYAKGCATHNLTAEMAVQQGLTKTTIHPQKIAHHVGLYTMAERGALIASTISL
ncbi:MAG: isochorismatase family protein [Tychonema bourrellyi B0820]|uniref:Isochorismatase n=1 Tax=Tychonema bourrellyi FEM_GT703 TaxID=2040638 RepID=A0A2G4F424_9CYAN|nr:isochorismatase family protein [Tychonema bourrellyi]MDQ2096319.1 isochorismatase family protein [Tychonema bourrellyi B0820]PHX56496.1 isochorismatase [Tychonema bourrellyi FEM_GT703]